MQCKNAIAKHKDIIGKLCKDCKDVFMKHYSLDKAVEEAKKIDSDKGILKESYDALQ